MKAFIHRTSWSGRVKDLALLLVFGISILAEPARAEDWKKHSMERPRPPVISPGTPGTPDQPGEAPSDAVVLFDGNHLDHWTDMQGHSPRWIVKDNAMQPTPGSGYVRTLRNFGDCQLHLEWMAPTPPKGQGQGRGNSGVFLMGVYEVQILDSYNNTTYADGQAASLYGQSPPLVNASRPPGEWQTYDIVFLRPRFDGEGNLQSPARMTVFHNGVLVQNHVTLKGTTGWMKHDTYHEHPEKLPLSLQDHGNPVRFRNIWVRELGEDAREPPQFSYPQDWLSRYIGSYKLENDDMIIRIKSGDHLMHVDFVRPDRVLVFSMVAASKTEFILREVDVRLIFDSEIEGKADRLTFQIGHSKRTARRLDES